MRKVIIEKDVYTFDELDESIQEQVAYDHICNSGYDCLEEYKDTLKDFEHLFGIKVDWSIGTYGGANYSWVRRFSYDNAEEITDANRFARWMTNNIMPSLKKKKIFYWKNKSRKSRCLSHDYLELCGMYTDSGLIQPIEECVSYKHGYTFESLVDECLDRFFSNWLKDMEYEETTEYFREIADANDYEFYADGTMA